MNSAASTCYLMKSLGLKPWRNITFTNLKCYGPRPTPQQLSRTKSKNNMSKNKQPVVNATSCSTIPPIFFALLKADLLPLLAL